MALRKYFKRKVDELESDERLEVSLESLREKKQHNEATTSQKRNFIRLNSRTRRVGKQNTHGFTATMLGRVCFVAYAKDGESFLQGLELHGQPEE